MLNACCQLVSGDLDRIISQVDVHNELGGIGEDVKGFVVCRPTEYSIRLSLSVRTACMGTNNVVR